MWAKREDVNSGLAYGGNKIRKLEYIVPDVLASGADTLVSIGGFQSNHTRQVAAVAAHLGLKCRLVQEKWVPWDDPTNTQVGNILLSRMMGADSRLDPHGFDIGIRDSWKDAIREVEEAGGTPYAIPAGASEHPLGGLGFASWAFEVAEQEKALGITFDTIVVCTVTGSTHAGMIAGFAALEDLTGVRRRVIGIDASATLEKTRDQVDRIARSTAELIELGRDLRDDEVTVLEGWAGELYGVPVDSTMEAMALGAQLEAMITDPVYEGKSLAGLVDLVSAATSPPTRTCSTPTSAASRRSTPITPSGPSRARLASPHGRHRRRARLGRRGAGRPVVAHEPLARRHDLGDAGAARRVRCGVGAPVDDRASRGAPTAPS